MCFFFSCASKKSPMFLAKSCGSGLIKQCKILPNFHLPVIAVSFTVMGDFFALGFLLFVARVVIWHMCQKEVSGEHGAIW